MGLNRRFRQHPTWHLLLRLRKVGFRGSLGTLRRGPWAPGDVKIDFFFKILNGLEKTLQATPHMAPFASFEKSRFSGALGTLRRGPWGPGEVKIGFFFKILNRLEQTLPTMPHLLYLDSKNKFLKILRPPRNFPKFPEILNWPGTPLEWFKLN